MIEERPDFAKCWDCDGQIVFRVWGEGIDSSVYCEVCDNEEIYR